MQKPVKNVFMAVLLLLAGAVAADESHRIWVDLDLDAEGKPVTITPLAVMPKPVELALRKAILGWTFQTLPGKWSDMPSTTATLVILRSIDKADGGTTLEFERIYEGPRPIKTLPIPLEPGIAPPFDETVVVSFTVGRNGFAKSFRIEQKGSRNEYDRAVVESLRHWRFLPRTVAGQKISYRVNAFPMIIETDR